MQKNKIWNIVCAIFWVLQFVAEAAAVMYIFWLDMLPVKYLILAVALLVVVWLLVGAAMFLYRKSGHYETQQKTGPSAARRIISMALALIIVALCIALCFVLRDVRSTVSDITKDWEVEGVTMAVYVLQEDPAQSIADASDYCFGVVEGYETERTNSFIDNISDAAGSGISLTYCASISEMIDALYAGEVEAIILNSAYVDVMEDNEVYTDFSNVTRILYSEVIAEQENTDSSENTETTEESQVVVERHISTDPFIVYVSGSDTRNTYLSTTSRSDVNIIMVVNPVTKQVLLINTPRDYYIPNPSGNGALDKLTHCGIYGISCSMEALNELYGVQIDYYAQINFTGFEKLIDAIGGIEVYSDWGFYAGSNCEYWISKGYNYMDGEKALAFARERHHLSSGDNGRGQNQMKVITAVIQKATSGTTIISNYASILDSIQGMFRTDISSEEISELVKMQLDDMAQWTVLSYAVTGTGGSEIPYSMPGLYAYVMWPDQDTVDYASDLIGRVMAGEVLTSEDIG